MILSAIRVPIQWSTPETQHARKNYKRTRSCIRTSRSWKNLGLLSALVFTSTPTIYSLPGANHALISGSIPSLDATRQQKYIQTIVQRTTELKFSSSNHPIALSADTTPDDSLPMLPFCFIADTDSFPFVLDSGANRFIVNDATLFQTFAQQSGRVKGIGGKTVPLLGVGKIRLPLKSDDGTIDTIIIEDAVYIPTSPYNLVPPQILLKRMKENGYHCDYTKHDDKDYIFQYRPPSANASDRRLTIPIGPNNLFSIRSSEGYTAFFRQATHYAPEWDAFAGSSHVIPMDDDDEQTSQRTGKPREFDHRHTTGKTREAADQQPQSTIIPFQQSDFDPIKDQPIDSTFDLQGSEEYRSDPAVEINKRKQQRLATIHEKLGHLSFSRLKLMAKAGLIPRELASIEPPTCPGCAYGKAHRRPWRYKGSKNIRPIRPATAPGQVVSTDQIISPTEGFVPTHRGTPTIQRYHGATVFVDHFSDFTYVHLMTKMDAEATVEAKLTFERLAASHGVTIRHYHADNGLFDSKLFKESIQKSHQTLSFCGVNAHHQNGQAESRVKDVTTGARTALLHAAHRWPKAINAALWPSALKHYTNIRNSLPTEFIPGEKQGRKLSPGRYEQSPLSKFTGTEVEPNLDHFHPFGSPVYVLENNLQAHHAHNKWEDRSRVGIFLCHSPSHASNVPLVLNTQTGLVSPQFHCIFDNQFDTCKRDAKFVSLWQFKAKLQMRPDKSTVERFDALPTKNGSASVQQSRLLHAPANIPQHLITPWDLPFPCPEGESTVDIPANEPIQQQTEMLPPSDNLKRVTV